MDVYVVQPGDNIESIAAKYGVSIKKLIQDNEIGNPEDLVPGQTIVIAYPEQTYTVQEGDSLAGIAKANGVTLIELLRNNPFLSGREFIYPGETLTIRYHTDGQITTNGYAYPYIKKETLLKTLPNLTYLTIFNYRTTEKGDIIAYYDDSDIIKTAKDYSVVPLMMVSTLTPQGQQNINIAYSILLSEEYQEHHITNIINILKAKGYYGVSLTINYMNIMNQSLYENFIIKVAASIHKEGFLCFITINPNIQSNNEVTFEKVDYSKINQVVDGIVFLQFIWGNNFGPPEPISNINNIRTFLEYVIPMVSPDKIAIGKPTISYDWELPYIPGSSSAYSLTIDAALALAMDVGASIQFDEPSQTPYFTYERLNFGAPAQHIVWSIDARSIDALDKLIQENNLSGLGVWNIMVYYAQLWLVINSQHELVRVIPVNDSQLSGQ